MSEPRDEERFKMFGGPGARNDTARKDILDFVLFIRSQFQ